MPLAILVTKFKLLAILKLRIVDLLLRNLGHERGKLRQLSAEVAEAVFPLRIETDALSGGRRLRAFAGTAANQFDQGFEGRGKAMIPWCLSVFRFDELA